MTINYGNAENIEQNRKHGVMIIGQLCLCSHSVGDI